MTSPARSLAALLAPVLAALAAAAPPSAPASAAIRCHGAYQVTGDGAEIGTPWCEAEYLASIAAGYGIAVSGREIRGSVAVKREICQRIGSDYRLQTVCGDQRRPAPRGGTVIIIP
ncbi:MAG: hypothetical protein R3D33_12380 [Hyphomicrobiaceae bacterium]